MLLDCCSVSCSFSLNMLSHTCSSENQCKILGCRWVWQELAVFEESVVKCEIVQVRQECKVRELLPLNQRADLSWLRVKKKKFSTTKQILAMTFSVVLLDNYLVKWAWLRGTTVAWPGQCFGRESSDHSLLEPLCFQGCWRKQRKALLLSVSVTPQCLLCWKNKDFLLTRREAPGFCAISLVFSRLSLRDEGVE